MTLKRVAAVLAAVALVVGAILLRNGLDDSSAASDDEPAQPGSYSVVCSTEFAEVCQDLPDTYAVAVEAAGVTLDRLSAVESADLPDAWLTLDPFPAMLDETRERSHSLPAAVAASDVLAMTDQTYSLPAPRAELFAQSCGTEPVAKCVGDKAGVKWTDLGATDIATEVNPGIADPSGEALGLLTFANGVAGYFGTTDLQSNLWQGNAGFSDWMRNFVKNVTVLVSGSPLNVMLVRPSLVDVAATTSAQVASNEQASSESVGTLSVAPAFRVRAVLATLGNRSNALPRDLSEALAAHGWTAPAADEPALPQSTFIALRQLWKETT